MLKFATCLRDYRQLQGYTQAYIAKRLGVSRQYINQVELGQKGVSLAQAAKLANILGIAEEDAIKLVVLDSLRAAGLSNLEITITKETYG